MALVTAAAAAESEDEGEGEGQELGVEAQLAAQQAARTATGPLVVRDVSMAFHCRNAIDDNILVAVCAADAMALPAKEEWMYLSEVCLCVVVSAPGRE